MPDLLEADPCAPCARPEIPQLAPCVSSDVTIEIPPDAVFNVNAETGLTTGAPWCPPCDPETGGHADGAMYEPVTCKTSEGIQTTGALVDGVYVEGAAVPDGYVQCGACCGSGEMIVTTPIEFCLNGCETITVCYRKTINGDAPAMKVDGYLLRGEFVAGAVPETATQGACPVAEYKRIAVWRLNEGAECCDQWSLVKMADVIVHGDKTFVLDADGNKVPFDAGEGGVVRPSDWMPPCCVTEAHCSVEQADEYPAGTVVGLKVHRPWSLDCKTDPPGPTFVEHCGVTIEVTADRPWTLPSGGCVNDQPITITGPHVDHAWMIEESC